MSAARKTALGLEEKGLILVKILQIYYILTTDIEGKSIEAH